MIWGLVNRALTLEGLVCSAGQFSPLSPPPDDPELCRVFCPSWDCSDKVQAEHRISALFVNWKIICCWGFVYHDDAFSTKYQKIFVSLFMVLAHFCALYLEAMLL